MAGMLAAVSSLLRTWGSPPAAKVEKTKEPVEFHTSSVLNYDKDGNHEVLQFVPVYRPKPRKGEAFKLDVRRTIEIGKPSSVQPAPKFSTVHFHKYAGPPPKMPSRQEAWQGVSVVKLEDPEHSFLKRMLEYSPCALLTIRIHHLRGFIQGKTFGWQRLEEFYFLQKKMNDEMIRRFTVADKAPSLGEGASANVYPGIDNLTKESVAIKISKESTSSSIAEITSAMKVQRFSNIVRLKGFFLIGPKSHAIVYERAPPTLHHDIFRRNLNKRPYSKAQIAFIASQILTTLSEMHPRFIYTDIASGNISVNLEERRCIMLDLGGIKDCRRDVLPPEITQQPFRSPESILGGYDCKTDIFSLGCVIFNLIALDYLFPYKVVERYVDPITKREITSQIERDSIWQLSWIIGTLGPISREMLNRSSNLERYFNGDRFKFPLQASPKLLDKRLASIGTLDPELTDFVKQCLVLDPLKRPSAKMLLEHPFIRSSQKGSKDEKKA